MPLRTRPATTADPAVDWRRESRCATEPPEVFFPIGVGPAAQRQARRAKAICRECPVRQPCLDWALEAGVRHGVFGGLDEEERLALRAPRPRRG